ncbi:hypothetical protein C2I36_12560 [Rhodobacteraceae bacterium WD3A24]|nr:hypothetical protein C2I36_12560 [Rhodobacteraceae bacterium WD3A24]
MKGVAFTFFVTGVVAVVFGMGWGLHMAASGDHAMAGAHAHLNLVGWASFALFGLYYHVTPKAAASVLARIHYAVALAGLVVMVIGIALTVRGGSELPAVLGSLLTAASMLIFLYTVAGNGLGGEMRG